MEMVFQAPHDFAYDGKTAWQITPLPAAPTAELNGETADQMKDTANKWMNLYHYQKKAIK